MKLPNRGKNQQEKRRFGHLEPKGLIRRGGMQITFYFAINYGQKRRFRLQVEKI